MSNRYCAYSEGITHQKIAIIGIEPPPLGGVSVHITRVMDLFIAQHNRVYLWHAEAKRRLFPIYLFRLFWWLVRRRPDRVYYHTSYLPTAIFELWFLMVGIRLLKYRLFIVDHDCRHLSKRSNNAINRYKKIIASCNGVICIGESVKKSYTDLQKEADHITIDEAFIPPSLHQAAHIRAGYPPSLTIFIKERTPIVLLSAAHLMIIDGHDVYGIDTALDMLALLIEEYPDIGLVIALATVADHAYFDQLLRAMKKLGIAENIFILHGSQELWPLFKQADIFIRPTRSDGDSISVREALYFKVLVVASDISPRPFGVHTFKTGDSAEAAQLIGTLLKNYVYGKKQCDSLYTQSKQ